MPDLAMPLIATADEQLLDDALRWCAAVGVTPEIAADVTGTRRSWRHASLVLVGDDLVAGLAGAGLPRREHVVLVAREPDRWWADAVRLGAAGVCAPHEEERILEMLAAALDGRGEGCLVSIIGASGGLGGSTLTAALGLAGGRRGLRSLVLDADPLGGGLDLLMGSEAAEGLRWHDFDTTRGRLSAGSLIDVLPVHRGVSTLSWGRSATSSLPASVPSVLTAAVRGFDLVVADVPRHLDRFGREIVGRSVLCVLVVGEDLCSVGAARRVSERLHDVASSIVVVSVARPGGIGTSATAEALGLPVLVRHRHDRRLRAAVDRGFGPGRSRAARHTAQVLLDTLGLDAP